MLKFLISGNVNGSSGWVSTDVKQTNSTTISSAKLLFSGNIPCIAYNSSGVKFAYATDASGTSWNEPYTIYSDSNHTIVTATVLSNGRFLIAYYSYTSNNYQIAVSSTTNGSGTWNTYALPVTVATGKRLNVTLINGNPALVTDGIYFTYAKNAYPLSASDWYTSQQVVNDPTNNHYPNIMALSNSDQAIIYATPTDFIADEYGVARFVKGVALGVNYMSLQ